MKSNIKDNNTCCLCHKPFTHCLTSEQLEDYKRLKKEKPDADIDFIFSNNAYPLAKGRCCNVCDMEVVKARIQLSEIKQTAVYDVELISYILKVNKQTIREYIKKGNLKAKKIGNSYQAIGKDIIDFVRDTMDS